MLAQVKEVNFVDSPSGQHLVLSRSTNGTLRTFNLGTGEKVASWSIASEDPARTSVTWWVLTLTRPFTAIDFEG